MKIRNLQSLLVCPIILWRVSSTEDDWIFGWRSRLASQILILFLPFTFLHCGRMEQPLSWRIPLIQFMRIRSWWRCRWICKNVSRKTMCVSQMLGGPSLRLGVTKECLNIPSGIGWGGKDTGRLVTWEFPLRTDSASWKSLESFIQFTSFCNSCTLPESSKIVFWSSINFRLAIVSNAELWNFRNSSISVRLRWWASRSSNFCCQNCPWRSRRSSSAWAAWSSWWPILAWHSARIVCLCSSSRVLICAFELLHSSGCPDLSTISPSGCADLSNRTDDDNWLTDTPSCTK